VSSDPTEDAGDNPYGQTAAPISLVDVRCALCGSSDAEPHAHGYDSEYNTTGNAFRFVRCRSCGHVYLHPRPSASDLGVIYPSNYYTLSGSKGLVARMQRLWEGGKVRHYADFLGPGPRRILDAGCGDGRFLEVLRSAAPGDWQLVGIDFDPAAVERCKGRGFEAYATRIEDFDQADGTFDAVIMQQLIEHVDDPVAISRRIFEILKPGGIFVVETPNLAGADYHLFHRKWWGHYHFPRHWNLFSTERLHAMLEQVGFEIAATEYLISTSAWTVSLHNYFLDKKLPGWFVNRFHYKNPVLLGTFIVLDKVRTALGYETSNQRVIARKPAA
jgi:2-polyprenyl-3-methyl-5-hydroxy-6-metoxy-1,4-benzoquinol methylase